MVITLKLPQYLLINLILLIANFFNWPNPCLQLIFGGLFLILNSLAIGNWLFIKNSWICKFLYGLLFILVFASLIGTASFYLFNLSNSAQAAAMLIISAVSLIIVKKHPVILDLDYKLKKIKFKIAFLTTSYLACLAAMALILYRSQTAGSIRSPWEVLPTQIFLLYFLATFILYAIIKFSKTSNVLPLISLHSFLSFSVAWIIFKIGFDYDPFIHRTNIDLILKNGTLEPKPFYYIGQYSLIIFLNRLLKISAEYLDKLLIPLAAAIYFPATVYYAVKDNFKAEIKIILFSVLTILIFPFTSFIVTTPQALANLLSLIAILLSFYYVNHPKVALWPLAMLVLMTISIHPLAGIPLFFFFILLAFYQHWQKKFNLPKIFHRSILWEIFILGCLALPIAFFINSSTMSQLKVSLNSNWLGNILSSIAKAPTDIYYRPFISLIDLVYNYGNNIILVIIALAAAGLFFIIKHQQLKHYFVYLISFIMLWVNYLLLKGMISFFSLLAYEQISYPRRVLEISLYLLLPFILIALYLFFKKVLKQTPIFILLTLILLSLGITFSFYLSYPRVDKIVEDHGYSTSLTDIKTVKFIEEIQKGQPYVVLAAQPVSAAAIKELGFKYYYNGFFFYPVPTGSRMYQLYEDLAYAKQKTADTIATVKYLTGVNDVYFVLNNYWFNALNIIARQKKIADRWFAIDGKNYIFKYSD